MRETKARVPDDGEVRDSEVLLPELFSPSGESCSFYKGAEGYRLEQKVSFIKGLP